MTAKYNRIPRREAFAILDYLRIKGEAHYATVSYADIAAEVNQALAPQFPGLHVTEGAMGGFMRDLGWQRRTNGAKGACTCDCTPRLSGLALCAAVRALYVKLGEPIPPALTIAQADLDAPPKDEKA